MTIRKPSRGVTLLETIVAVTIMAFVFAFSGFLIFMSARNAYNINSQIRSQNSASNAGERATALLRDAAYFALWPGDDTGTTATVSRVRFAVPAAGNTVTTQVLCYNPERERVEYYASEPAVQFVGFKRGIPVPHGRPTGVYPGVASFMINWESEFRLTLLFSFKYSGFALKDKGENLQFGQLITDVIARNHFMDEGVQNYAEADVATSSPATL